MRSLCYIFIWVLFMMPCLVTAQEIQWSADGNSYFESDENGISKIALNNTDVQKIMPATKFTRNIRSFSISKDETKILLYTNSKRVWRYDTRGDYYVYDIKTDKLTQLGAGMPESSLMFAKFTDDGSKVAFVSKQNVYIQNLNDYTITAVTTNGQRRFINGTFDWVYEEEFDCRDGIRWSPDGSKLLYWEVDATPTRDFLMINNTDSVYSRIVPVEYPKVGEPPSNVRLIIYDIANKTQTPIQLRGDNVLKYYVPVAEWAPDSKEVMVQQLDRKQQVSNIWVANASTGAANIVYTEKDEAWIDCKNTWDEGLPNGWLWLDKGKSFLWMSEKSGWRQVYKISRDGKTVTQLTNNNYDVIELKGWNEKTGKLLFMASPDNAMQRYLYASNMLKPTKPAVRVTPKTIAANCFYEVSPNAQYAQCMIVGSKMNLGKPEWIKTETHKTLEDADVTSKIVITNNSKAAFFKVTTSDGVTMDGWMLKPDNFDASKKYPVLFHVYGEPGSTTVNDYPTVFRSGMFKEAVRNEGYIVISLDNRGTPAPKGRTWRKALYKKIGQLNIKDQALGAKEIMKWPYVDAERIAICGWSGGGASTLNALFQYPEIYKTGIAVAAITNELNYDNIYTERYMGLPQENMQDYINCSPITYAKNLKGNLLYIHGTGDDNVHYQNAEQLINELIKQGKQFSFMAYPNRTHGIREGEGTTAHLQKLCLNYLKANCAPGGR
jgi:dipeptidyl-peptidase 4